MTVRISVGRWGSGKTASEVRDLLFKHRLGYRRKIVTNIIPTDPKKLYLLEPLRKEMIFKEEVIGHKKNGDPIIKVMPNIEYWTARSDPVDIIIDEAHEFFNSRRSSSAHSVCFQKWLALVRRWINRPGDQTGELVLITQRFLRLDVDARELCQEIRHYTCTFVRQCLGCKRSWLESSEEALEKFCPYCYGIKFRDHSHTVAFRVFRSVDEYNDFIINGDNTVKPLFIPDIWKVFGLYDTLQIENFLE